MLRLLKVYGCEARNIHGNMFQSGIPDIVVTSKYGVTFFCELKMWRRVYGPTSPRDLFVLLRKTQKLYIQNVWERSGYCLIVACTHDGRAVFYTDGVNVAMSYPDVFCKYLANLTPKDFT